MLSAGGNLRGPYVVDPLTLRGPMITRSLGDRDLRRIGIISEPEIVTVRLASDDIGFVLATDGLWDVVADSEVAALCRHVEAQNAADSLVELVVQRDGGDNITVIVLRFPHGQESPPPLTPL